MFIVKVGKGFNVTEFQFPKISRKNVLSRLRNRTKLIQDPTDQALYGATQASMPMKQADDTIPQQVSTPTSIPNAQLESNFQSKGFHKSDEPSLSPVRQITSDAMPSVPQPLGDGAGQKTLNLFWSDRQLEKIVGELAKDKNRNDEITQAIHAIQIARYLMKAYGDRLRASPNT